MGSLNVNAPIPAPHTKPIMSSSTSPQVWRHEPYNREFPYVEVSPGSSLPESDTPQQVAYVDMFAQLTQVPPPSYLMTTADGSSRGTSPQQHGQRGSPPPEYQDVYVSPEPPRQINDLCHAPETTPADLSHPRLGPMGIGFVEHPRTEFYQAPPYLRKDQMTRVFIGQMPYTATAMHVDWICHTFASVAVYHHERIMKRQDPKIMAHHGAAPSEKLPTGCFHVYCDPRDVAHLVECLHKRVLNDDCGAWYARTEVEGAELNAYCHELKMNKKARPFNRPYDTVVVQLAESNFVPAYNSRRQYAPQF